jgi:serine/threonine protein kinase
MPSYRPAITRGELPQNPFDPKLVESAFSSRIRLGMELRVGGQGVVFRAQRVRTPTGEVALDEIALKLHLDPREDARAEREIKAMEGNRHPHLANLIEHGIVPIAGNRVRYAAWEFIEGEPLDHRLRAGALTARTVAVVGRDVARAIEHLWNRDRIVHRDINPKNVMLRTGSREAVLIDLGAAKFLNQAPITGPALTWGTNGYFSPEQAHASPNLTAASDVFTLGITMQELLVGRHPVHGDQNALLFGGPKTRTVCPAAPAALADLIDRMVSQRPAFRPLPQVVADECAKLVPLL